jgi:hypothetical protein
VNELGDNEEIIGELIETQHFPAEYSEIRRGDAVAFKLRRSALTAQLDETLDAALGATNGAAVLAGEVRDILQGREQPCYLVRILSKTRPWPAGRTLIVPKRSILKVVTGEELAEAVARRRQEDSGAGEEA